MEDKKHGYRDGVFATIEEAQVEIFDYIESYYNTKRRHSGIGYQIPAEFENRYYQAKQLTI